MNRPYISLQNILQHAYLGTGKVYVEYRSDRCDSQLYAFDTTDDMTTFFSTHHGAFTGVNEYRGVPTKEINVILKDTQVYIDDEDEVYTFSSKAHAESFSTLFK